MGKASTTDELQRQLARGIAAIVGLVVVIGAIAWFALTTGGSGDAITRAVTSLTDRAVSGEVDQALAARAQARAAATPFS